jgi:hypothetical protein
MFAFHPVDPNVGPSGNILARVEWEGCHAPATNLLYITNRGGKNGVIESFFSPR